jgi:hypothetical protein
MGKNLSVIGMALFVCLSCCTGTDGDGNGYDRTTVLGTLSLFEDVWNDGDVDTYESLLAEDFTFYFDPADVGGGWGIPPSWGYEEEIQAYTNLFDAVGEENVDVVLDFSEVTEPEEGVDTFKVEDVPYEVLVHIEEEGLILPARAHLDMELTKVDGEWFITDWWDRVTYRLLAMETTWGEIKAFFF